MTPEKTGASPIDQNLVRALAHPTRVQILEALQGRAASPSEMAREFDKGVPIVAYHANVLIDVGCIEQVRTHDPGAVRSNTSTPPPRARSSATRTGAGRRSRSAAA